MSFNKYSLSICYMCCRELKYNTPKWTVLIVEQRKWVKNIHLENFNFCKMRVQSVPSFLGPLLTSQSLIDLFPFSVFCWNFFVSGITSVWSSSFYYMAPQHSDFCHYCLSNSSASFKLKYSSYCIPDFPPWHFHGVCVWRIEEQEDSWEKFSYQSRS